MLKEEFIAEINLQKDRGNKLLQQVQQMRVGRNIFGDGMAVFGTPRLYYTPKEELEPVKAEYSSWKLYVHDFLVSALDDGDDFVTEWDSCLQEPYRHDVSERDWYTKEIKEALGKLDSFVQRAGFRFNDNPMKSVNKISLTRAFDTRKVFIVHGHDTNVRNEVELFISSIGYEPIILCKRADKGNTIIEKIEREAKDVCFAIVIYTSCDLGKDKNTDVLKPRARQNVVFEHGFMCAHLGRERVCALLEDGVEQPGDLQGVIYKPLDVAGAWKYQIADEMKAVGLEVDKNQIK